MSTASPSPDYEPLNDVDMEELHDALAVPNYKRAWYVIDAVRDIVNRHENSLTRALLRERDENGRLRGEVKRIAAWLGDEPDLGRGHALDVWRELTDLVRTTRDTRGDS